MDARLVRAEQWMKALVLHEPGVADDAVRVVGSWTAAQVRMLWIDASGIIQIMRNPRELGLRKELVFTVRAEGQSREARISYTSTALRRLTALACAAAGLAISPNCNDLRGELDADLLSLATRSGGARSIGDDNLVLRRGALLHADIEMLTARASEPIATSAVIVGPQRFRRDASDGLTTDLGEVAPHWEVARMLLDNVRPSGMARPAPGRDDMVRLWYRATAAWMQERKEYSMLHLDRAREILPGDADILFLSGSLRELYARPVVQSAMRESMPWSGAAFDVQSQGQELRQAETLFRAALKARPAFPEAHLRLGRVLMLLERPADAAHELRQALGSTDDRLLLYYGELFLGEVQEVLGQFDGSRTAYEAAAALYPSAQSPKLALSAIAARRGDRSGALGAMQQVFELPVRTGPDRDDPW
jgi:hypothetical protein